MDTQSYAHPWVAARTCWAMESAVISGPEAILMGTRLAVEATLTWVPPISMTRTFMGEGYRVGGLSCQKNTCAVNVAFPLIFVWLLMVFRGHVVVFGVVNVVSRMVLFRGVSGMDAEMCPCRVWVK